jgi:thiol-disulfide isomerase/thioredoxin
VIEGPSEATRSGTAKRTALGVWLPAAAGAIALLGVPAGATVEQASVAPSAETRIVEYLKANVRPGQAVVVSDLYNRVFTSPEERAVLDRLFNTFFKMPLAIAQQQRASGRPPTLREISEQFHFTVPGEADVLLRIMAADPRMPRFLERDPASGEITRVDVAAILADRRFGTLLERTLAGWEGRPAPALSAVGFDGTPLSSTELAGRPYLVYFWFSGCPPCTRSAPLLAGLQARYGPRGFVIVALNADRALELAVSDEERAAYAGRLGPGLRFAHASAETLRAWGSVSLFPSFFFVDRNGAIVRHLFNFQEGQVLEDAVRRALE